MTISSPWEELRHACRSLRRTPGFTIIATVTLAIGIGATTAIFSLVDAVLLRPLPYQDPSRLVFISVDPNSPTGGIYESNYAALASDTRVFDGVARYYRNSGWSRVTLTGREPESVQGAFVSANVFSVMGVAPAIGRALTDGDEARRDRVVVLSDKLWKRRFGASPTVVGTTMQVDGVSAEIVGVMPASFQFPAPDAQFWAPITTNRFWTDPAVRVKSADRNRFFYTRWQAIGRLRPGVDAQTAQAALNILAGRLPETDPVIDAGFGLSVIPLRLEIAANTRLTLLMLFGAVSAVLLIGCANIANLTVARGTTRRRELAIRAALGAGRGRLVRQLFTESLTLAAIAAALGLVVAVVAIQALVRFAPAGIPRLDEARVDVGVLAFTGALSMCTAVLFGLVPAWKISRSDPSDALRSGTARSGHAASATRLRGLLVIVEFALAVLLLAAAGLLVRSAVAIRAVDPGFNADRILTMRIAMPAATPDRRTRALADEVRQRLRTLPGVRAVGAIDAVFELGAIANFGLRSIDGRQLSEGPATWSAPLSLKTVSGDYFQAMGAPLLRGRLFSDDDDPKSPLVAIVDESMARRYWPRQDPIGQRFKGQDHRGVHDDWITVVGVVGDMRRHGLDRQPTAHVYLPQRQEGSVTPDLVVRTAGDPKAVAASVRGVVRSLDATAILSPATTLEQQIDLQLAPRRFQTWLLGLFSLVALVLAGVGIYGVMHCAAAERRQEMGIRMALGAQRRGVVGMMLRDALMLAAVGLAAGLLGALWVTRLIANLLFGVTPADPLTFAVVSVFLMAVAAGASVLPAWRAARVDPLVALRSE